MAKFKLQWYQEYSLGDPTCQPRLLYMGWKTLVVIGQYMFKEKGHKLKHLKNSLVKQMT